MSILIYNNINVKLLVYLYIYICIKLLIVYISQGTWILGMDLTRPRPEPEPEPGPIYQSGPKRGSTLGFFGWSIFCVFIWIKEIKKKKRVQLHKIMFSAYTNKPVWVKSHQEVLEF